MLFPETVIAGCGNPLFADDGFGPAVARELRNFRLPDTVKVVDAGTCGTYYVFTLLDPGITKRLIILDAVDFGAKPGSIALLRPDILPPGCYCDRFLWDTVDPLDLIKGRIDVLIIAVQPKRVTYPDIEMKLSDEVRKAIPESVQIVLGALDMQEGWISASEKENYNECSCDSAFFFQP
jgi:coenzyme F420 hydrogenase subunit delta